jgi:type II secretory pathway pseudopilin PulG
MIELMVCIVIITTALSGIIALFPYIIQKNVRIQIQGQAVNLLQNETEKLRALRYYDPELDALGGAQGMSSIRAEGPFLVRVTVRYLDPKTSLPPDDYPTEISQDTGLKEATVSVKRKDNVGSQVNLVTYFSRAKPGQG